MNKQQRQRIIDRHSDSLLRFGHHPNALYWSGRDIQELRFKVLAEIGIEHGNSILDVGCGFADLNTWLSNNQYTDVQYHGIDISPDLIGVAKKIHPDVSLSVGELFDGNFTAQQFDWLLLSGALNEPYHDHGVYAKKVISEMYQLCRQGVAFNLLNAQVIKVYDLQSFEPQEMLDFCREICPSSQLRTDYLANDFTIYMFKTHQSASSTTALRL
ncbi:MAG: class I SAM-dependent methyltransferase [Ghiorsea sp.]